MGTEPQQTWRQLYDEGAALELLTLEDRLRELEGDVATYRMLAAAALESLAQFTTRNRQLANRIDHLNGQLRDLFNAPCQVCRRAARSERAA